MRGRVDAYEAARRPWDVRLPCHFEEHTADIEDNQILTYTLWLIAQSGVCTERVLPTVRRAYRSLQHATSLYKKAPKPSETDIQQVVAYATALHCREAVLIYPHGLDKPRDYDIGGVHVRTLSFALDGDLERAGQAFLQGLRLGVSTVP